MRPGPALAPPGLPSSVGAMAFTFAAFCYMLTLVLCASLIFFVIWHVRLRLGAGWVAGGSRSGRGAGGNQADDGLRTPGNLETPVRSPLSAGFCWPPLTSPSWAPRGPLLGYPGLSVGVLAGP